MTASRHSPGLRKRQLAPEAADEKAASKSASTFTSKRLSATPYFLFVLSAILSATYLLHRPQQVPSLPHEYALCSPDGARIYTVDDTLPKAECLVVRGENFVDVGTLSTYRVRQTSCVVL